MMLRPAKHVFELLMAAACLAPLACAGVQAPAGSGATGRPADP
jgi:hypothetical protein